MVFLDILKGILFGIVEGITEWLPVSSTGHMIILNQFVHFTNVSNSFFSLFEVVIQLGAALAALILYFKKLNPFTMEAKHFQIKISTLSLWMKIIIACIPAAIISFFITKKMENALSKPIPIAIVLIVVGILFIVVEKKIKNRRVRINKLSKLTIPHAIMIGLFQVVAAIFPGASRSGMTIMGSLLMGIHRPIATRFTFMLAIPVIIGASILKMAKYKYPISSSEVLILLVAFLVAFLVSMIVMKTLIGFVKKHTFILFGYYRIILGIVVIAFVILNK